MKEKKEKEKKVKEMEEKEVKKENENRMDFSELVTKREIVLHTADLGDGDLGVLSEVLEKTEVLESLNLSVNRLTLEDGRFTDALSRNATLKELVLDANKIRSEGAWWLGRALMSNTTLERLSLDGNKLGDAAAGHVADLLAANDALVHLSLGANRIGQRGARRLAAALRKNTGLATLAVNGNKIGGAARDFVAALEANGTLTALHVGSAKDPAQQQVDRLLASPERKTRAHEARPAQKDDRKDDLLKELALKDAEIANRDRVIVNMGLDIESREISGRIKDKEIEKMKGEVARRDQVIVNMGRDIESKEIRAKLAEKGGGGQASSAAAHHEEEGTEKDPMKELATLRREREEVAKLRRELEDALATLRIEDPDKKGTA